MASLNRIFFDTSVLVSGLIDQGEASRAPHAIFDAVVTGGIEEPRTAWHCCLETFAVLTRLPHGLQVDAETAAHLIEGEILAHFRVCQLPSSRKKGFLASAAANGVAGGRVYDAHVAEVARQADTVAVVTDNRRHFTALLRFGIPVLTAAEFATEHIWTG